MASNIIIKSGTTSISGATVKGDFSYFSASTHGLGPTSVTGLYSGINAPRGGYTLYEIGGPDGIIGYTAANSEQLNNALITAGATGTTFSQNTIWAQNTNSILVDTGLPLPVYYMGGSFTKAGLLQTPYSALLNSGGTLNASYNTKTGFNSSVVYSNAFDSDGKIVLGGSFTAFTGSAQTRLIRLNADGSKDTTFNIGTGFDGTVQSVAIDSNGKILVGGEFTTYTGSSNPYIIRLNADGSKDTTFNVGSSFNGFVYSVAIDSDGKILVGGAFTTFTGSSQNRLIRLNSDGSKDTTFNIGTGFGSTVYSVGTDINGKILAGGNFTTFTGVSQNYLVRLNSDGSKDTTFNIGTGFNNDVYTVSSDSNGKVIAGGLFTLFTGVTQNRIIRLNSDGSKDTTFSVGTGTNGAVRTSEITSDGSIFLGGGFTTYSGAPVYYLTKLNSDGTKNSGFNIGSGFTNEVRAVSVNSVGKVAVGGAFTQFSGLTRNSFVKYDSNYSIDLSFNSGNGFSNNVNGIAIDTSGRLVCTGAFVQYSGISVSRIIRIYSNGVKDDSFVFGTGFNGVGYCAINGLNNTILIGGTYTTYSGASQNRLVRLNTDGSKDTTFNIGSGFGNNIVYALGLYTDGKVLAGGSFTTFTGTSQNSLIRLNSDGSKDTSFDVGTGFNNAVRTISIDSSGKAYVGGQFTTYTGGTQNYFIKLNSDGSKDSTFNMGTGFNDSVYCSAIDSNGKILVGGFFTGYSGNAQSKLIRLNSDGSKDETLNLGLGFNSGATINAVSVDVDGNILVVGNITTYNGYPAVNAVVLDTYGNLVSNQISTNSTLASAKIY